MATAHASPRLPHSLVERTALLDQWLQHRARTCHQLLGRGKTLLAMPWRARLVSAGACCRKATKRKL